MASILLAVFLFVVFVVAEDITMASAPLNHTKRQAFQESIFNASEPGTWNGEFKKRGRENLNCDGQGISTTSFINADVMGDLTASK